MDRIGQQYMKLPPNVHVKNGRYYFVYKRKWTGLSRVDDGEAEFYRTLNKISNPAPMTVGGMIDLWLAEDHDLRASTMRDYRRAFELLRRTFGHQTPDEITQRDVAQYLEERGGVKANREIAALGSLYSWSMRKGWAEKSPTHGVRRNKERPRDRYVSNQELGQALRRTTSAGRDLLLAAYLTGLRQGDLRELPLAAVQRGGLVVREGKRGKRLVVTWSAPLRSLVERAKQRTKCDRLFTNTKGEPWGAWAVQSIMRRLEVDWTFHDVRAKAESDHKTGMGLLSRYKRSHRITPVGGRSSIHT